MNSGYYRSWISVWMVNRFLITSLVPRLCRRREIGPGNEATKLHGAHTICTNIFDLKNFLTLSWKLMCAYSSFVPGCSIVRMGGAGLDTSFLVCEWASDSAGLPSNKWWNEEASLMRMCTLVSHITYSGLTEMYHIHVVGNFCGHFNLTNWQIFY